MRATWLLKPAGRVVFVPRCPGNDQLDFALTTGTTVHVAGLEITFLLPGRLTFRKPKVSAP